MDELTVIIPRAAIRSFLALKYLMGGIVSSHGWKSGAASHGSGNFAEASSSCIVKTEVEMMSRRGLMMEG